MPSDSALLTEAYTSPLRAQHGAALKEIYEAKLKWQFPDRPCKVGLYIPDEPTALEAYELTFWQATHEQVDA